MTWSDVAVASAFVIGVGAGAIAAIRVFRYVLDYVRRESEPPAKGD